MSLPTPTLDDRTAQDIIDEAKRLIPDYCPEWTDHNVSDPGIALVELFAWMTEMIIYRLNQVPDRLYTRFLELVGIQLYSAAPARCELLFQLTAAQAEPVRILADTQVGTERTEQDESVVFMTDEELICVRPVLSACLTGSSDGRYENHWDDLRLPGFKVRCFPSVRPDDAVYLGFADSLAGNLIRLDVETSIIEGVGVDPKRPPWAWEAWSGREWKPARVLEDGTGGLNTGGALSLLLPARHDALALGPTRAFWVRCRMLAPKGDQPGYHDSPEIDSLQVTGLGGAVSAHHAEPVEDELLGRSDGEPGQVFLVRRTPVLPRRAGETVRIEPGPKAGPDAEPAEWEERRDFAGSGPQDLHFTWDGATGEIRFGPRVRYPDGSVEQKGAIPPKDARVVVTRYRHGGGRGGNVGAGTVRVPKTTIPFVASVRNPAAATGGVDAETVENARLRGPLSLRSGQRAVTAADFERLTLEAAPGVARARCLPPERPGGPVRVLVVPRVEVAPEALTLRDLALPGPLAERVRGYLDERRLLTTSVEVGHPTYQGVTIVATVVGAPTTVPELLKNGALDALFTYVNPLVGGPQGTGWPFDRDLNVGEIFALLSGLPGVVGVQEVELYLADLRSREQRPAGQRIRLPAASLFASFRHQVQVAR
jgi:predicted phage baseplate assembly protein